MSTLSVWLNTALPTPLVNPLCQKPPSPMMLMVRFFVSFVLNAAAPAHPSPYPIVVAPMLNGGSTEKRWQPMSQLTWCLPISRSTSFIAVKIGRSGQPVQNDGGRGWISAESAAMSTAAGAGATACAALVIGSIARGLVAAVRATDGTFAPSMSCGAYFDTNSSTP